MQMKLTTLTALLLLAGAASGCNTVKEAIRLNDSNRSTCEAPVIGTFESSERWSAHAPAMVRRGQLARPLRGDSIRVVGDSVYFDQSRLGPFSDPAPRMYPKSEFIVGVDAMGRTLFGSIPRRYKDNWEIHWLLRRAGEQGDATARMVLRPIFEYCLSPGVYEVLAMNFTTKEGYLIKSDPGPWLAFDVEAGTTNYVGSWTMNEAHADDSTSVVIPATIRKRPSDGMMGAAFGLVGGLTQVLINSSRNNYIEQVLNSSMESLPEPISDKPVRVAHVVIMNR